MSNALVDIREQIKNELEGVKGTVPAPSGRNISTKGKVFTFPDGKTTQGPISAVILDHRNFNRYFQAAYDPQNPKPPECFAISKDISGLGPHEEAKGPVADSCAECPMNKWGSAPTGKGKACRNTVRLAIIEPDADADAEPYILTVSPTALKSWAALVSGLEAVGKLPVQVVTQIAFDPNQAYPTLLFKAADVHDRLEEMWTFREKAQSLLDLPPMGD